MDLEAVTLRRIIRPGVEPFSNQEIPIGRLLIVPVNTLEQDPGWLPVYVVGRVCSCHREEERMLIAGCTAGLNHKPAVI